ncbi:invasin, partial [Salmonella enterica subsp. enterica]|nr:invasin [Salmonella enterica subsp. enterica]
VTFKNDGDSNTVIITAPPRSGGAIYQTVPHESRSV